MLLSQLTIPGASSRSGEVWAYICVGTQKPDGMVMCGENFLLWASKSKKVKLSVLSSEKGNIYIFLHGHH